MKLSHIIRSHGKNQQKNLSDPAAASSNFKATPFVPALQNPALKGRTAADSSEAIELYGHLIQEARAFLTGLSKKPVQLPDLDELCLLMEQTIKGVEEYPSKLLELTDRTTPEDYLPGHLVNVTVLAVGISQQLKWSKEVQIAVGIGSMLHDAALTFHKDLYSKPSILPPPEKRILMKVPNEGLAIMTAFIKDLSLESRTMIQNIIYQFQERISGAGYPQGLQAEQISREAQVVGICDTYESLSHPRPYRKRQLPHKVLRYLLELSGETFDGTLIKALWETLTLFPAGSFVKLSSGDIAKVVGLNRKLPTRPVVQVMVTPSGERMDTDKMIDLAQTPGLTVDGPVDECSLESLDKRTLLEFRAQKWWMK